MQTTRHLASATALGELPGASGLGPAAPSDDSSASGNGIAEVVTLRGRDVPASVRSREIALAAIERGNVVFLPDIGFELTESERRLVCDASATLPTRKEKESRNGRPTVTFDPDTGRLLRSRATRRQREELEAMMSRFATWAGGLVHDLFPGYLPGLADDRVTFRPCERAKPQGLHMDASYGRPTEGRAMLRVFCNIHPQGRLRVWEVGEHFDTVASRLFPQAKIQRAGAFASMLSSLGITRGRRTDYDLLMEDIRARLKADDDYQSRAPRRTVEFPSGTCWIALTDLVLHAAISGQYSLDRTFFVPPAAMHDPARSSLKILESMSHRPLV